MRDEIVAYIETRVKELLDIAGKAETSGDIDSAKVAIQNAIELNKVEIVINDIEIRETQKTIEEIKKKREEIRKKIAESA